MAKGKSRELLHKAAAQGGEVARPAGLIQRGGSWELRVRVPDRIRLQIGKNFLWKSFGGVSFADACRLARLERVAVDRRFAEAEAKLRSLPPAPLSDEELYELSRAFLHKMEVEAQRLPISPSARIAELESVDEMTGLVAQSLEDPTLQAIALRFAKWAGCNVEPASVDKPASPDFIRVCEAFQQAQIEHLGRRSERLSGRLVATVDPLFEGVSAGDPLSAPLTVSGAITAYKSDPERSGVAYKTRAAWEFRFRAIEEILGPEKLIGSLRREDVRTCRDKLIAMPANARKHFKGMSIAEATVANERLGLPTLSAKSVSLYVELLSSLFKWLEREEMVSRNPAKGVKGPPAPREKPRRPLTKTELVTLAEITGGGMGSSDGDVARTWTYWMVRIGLFNGMRLSEIAGLRVDDLVAVDGVWCFRIAPNQYRDLKTVASRRTIPVHPWLLAAGIRELKRSREPEALLLADAPVTPGTTNAAQKRIGRLVRGVLPDPKVSFHSLRHNFRDALRVVGASIEISARLGGWVVSENSAMNGYGEGHTARLLLECLQRIAYPVDVE
ncbi:integrase [Sphingomonas vulcanisoli]|uniref:Integrase n=1 Tax=Sphingomonas vulcanisoli TaxID=1658060 RepID=A0ABX0TRV3_9SPHN|nr:tyrosine-type recombinase/integrase [Sphingomonas vulcanisoli]NIJ08251.1 integrase [Sphingomonas vulcanisoli]